MNQNVSRSWLSLAILLVICLYSVTAHYSVRGQPTEPTIRFASIGDFGSEGSNEQKVADLVKSWNPDFIVTVGDNNYPNGETATIDANIGQYYHDFINPYQGFYGAGSPDINRFFPVLGNHDWGNGANPVIDCIGSSCVGPYLDYFTLPGNERYYDFVRGPVHFFALSGDPREPDGIKPSSVQAAWLQGQLTASTSPWQVVLVHQPPYSSGKHGSTANLQWPYKAWGVDAVLAGHDHNYERLVIDGLVYFVDGAGGVEIRPVGTPISGSQRIYTESFGALFVEANDTTLAFEYRNVDNTLIDSYVITQTITVTPTATPTNTSVPPTQTSMSTNTPTDTPTATQTSTPTSTHTPFANATPTATSTPTIRPSRTPANTSTPTRTPTVTDTPTQTSTPTPVFADTPIQTPEEQPTISVEVANYQFLPFLAR